MRRTYRKDKTKSSQRIICNIRVKHILDTKLFRTLYFTLVYPHLTYGITLWGSAQDTYLNKINHIKCRKIYPEATTMPTPNPCLKI